MRKLEPIHQLIQEAVENAPKDCNIQYLISIQNDLPYVEVDRKQIHHVFENIIRNAVEAMPEGGQIEFHAESATIGAENILQLSSGRYVRISIRDTGHGIKRENLSRVFDPYYTTKTKNGKKGLGLGLAVCHSVIKNHHGSITVESEAGAGTVFRLLLPSSSLETEVRTQQSSSS